MRKKCLLFTSLWVILLSTSVESLEPKEPKGEKIFQQLGTSYEIESKILKENRQILVHLPASYHSSRKKFPVLYLLDGNGHFGHAITASAILGQSNLIPEIIVVGIPNNPGTRSRDLFRKRDNFIRFFETEIMQFVNSNFRTSNHKTLFGHSAAGGFALSLLRGEYAHLFDHYITASPAISKNAVEEFENLIDSDHKFDSSVYFSLGSFELEAEAIQPASVQALGQLLEIKKPENLDWQYHEFPEQGHMTTPYLSLYRGLVHTFAKR
jgi:predicted alpha/beta superfamily hydrolase